MREDMFKIIVERPRRGWRSAPRCRGRLAGEDDLPAKIGTRRHVAVTRTKTKWLNENLQPLKRYLGRQLGRPWSEVYSEISEHLAPGHTVKEHVRGHLADFVAQIAIGRDGEWLAHSSHFGLTKAVWLQPYYVDPVDGLLKDSTKHWKKLGVDRFPWKRRKPKADPNLRKLSDGREFRCIEGIWYEISYALRPESDDLTFDLLKRAPVSARERHASEKRQLSRAELQLLGLSNQHRI